MDSHSQNHPIPLQREEMYYHAQQPIASGSSRVVQLQAGPATHPDLRNVVGYQSRQGIPYTNTSAPHILGPVQSSTFRQGACGSQARYSAAAAGFHDGPHVLDLREPPQHPELVKLIPPETVHFMPMPVPVPAPALAPAPHVPDHQVSANKRMARSSSLGLTTNKLLKETKPPFDRPFSAPYVPSKLGPHRQTSFSLQNLEDPFCTPIVANQPTSFQRQTYTALQTSGPQQSSQLSGIFPQPQMVTPMPPTFIRSQIQMTPRVPLMMSNLQPQQHNPTSSPANPGQAAGPHSSNTSDRFRNSTRLPFTLRPGDIYKNPELVARLGRSTADGIEGSLHHHWNAIFTSPDRATQSQHVNAIKSESARVHEWLHSILKAGESLQVLPMAAHQHPHLNQNASASVPQASSAAQGIKSEENYSSARFHPTNPDAPKLFPLTPVNMPPSGDPLKTLPSTPATLASNNAQQRVLLPAPVPLPSSVSPQWMSPPAPVTFSSDPTQQQAFPAAPVALRSSPIPPPGAQELQSSAPALGPAMRKFIDDYFESMKRAYMDANNPNSGQDAASREKQKRGSDWLERFKSKLSEAGHMYLEKLCEEMASKDGVDIRGLDSRPLGVDED